MLDLKKLKLQSNNFPLKSKVRFYADLQILLRAGLDLRTSLVLIQDDIKSVKFRNNVDAVIHDIVEGKSFSDALKSNLTIEEFEFYSLKIGEETGNLEHILLDLGSFYESRLNQRRQIISTLSYPIIIVGTAVGAVIFMLQVVVPLFQDVFKRFDRELPNLTKFVIKCSHFTETLLPWTLVLFVLILATFPLIKKNEIIVRLSARVLVNIPVFGPFVQKSVLLRLASSLELLLNSNTNLLRAVELAEKMIAFHPVSVALEAIQKDLKTGTSLTRSMQKHSIFTRRFLTLVKVGEEVNQLSASFGQIKDQYEKEQSLFSQTFGKVIEPLIIIFIGIFVGTIIVAMYLPMFELSTLL